MCVRVLGSRRHVASQMVEAVHVTPSGPTDTSKHKCSKQWVVQRPGVMSEYTDEHSSFCFFKRPHDRLRSSVYLGSREYIDFVRIADHWPIGLIDKMNGMRQALSDRIICRRD